MRGWGAIGRLAAAGLALAAWAGESGPPPGDESRSREIGVEELTDHVKYLASDALEGRDTGAEGGRKAAEYVVVQFKRLGLAPAGAEGTFFQPFKVGRTTGLGKRNALVADAAGVRTTLAVGEDFDPFYFSENGAVKGGVVFAGYGIAAKEFDYDDYAGLDVKGRVVLILRHEPQERDPKSKWNGAEWTPHAEFIRKAQAAAERGAAALLIVDDPLNHAKEPDRVNGKVGGGRGDTTIPVVHMRRAVAEAWCRKAGFELAKVQREIDETLEPGSRSVEGLSVELEVDLKGTSVEARNVLARLEGADPALKDEIVIIGAHYDHVGKKGSTPKFKGQVHNGADDNASGTSTMLEVAEALALAPHRPARSILFMAFDGEERGLLGSAYYARHPLVPLEKTSAMLNMDMVGRSLKDQCYVTGVGTAAIFPGLVERARTLTDLTLITGAFPSPAASDQMSFFAKQVPVLFIHTGIRNSPNYHKPGDDWDTLVYPSMAKVGVVCEELARAIADEKARPAFVKVEPPKAPPRPKVFLGVNLASAEEGETGVGIAGVTEGSPAAEAGLKEGDLLLAFDEKPLDSYEGLIKELLPHKPGDQVALKVRRGQETLTVSLTLAPRP